MSPTGRGLSHRMASLASAEMETVWRLRRRDDRTRSLPWSTCAWMTRAEKA